MSTARLLVGDVSDRLAEIPDGSVDLVMTSPPFLALRSYLPDGHPDKGKEIGSEATPAEFVDTLLALTAEWRRVLAPHGSICVELGDTYAGSGGAGGDYNPDGLREGQAKFNGSAKQRRTAGDYPIRDDNPRPSRHSRDQTGWPLEKSLTGIPTLYTWSLAYGRNLLRRPLSAREFMERVEAAAAEIPDITVPELLVLMRDLLAVWEEPGPSIGIEPWRIRNLVAWVRPNPPVGALGDKFRPATSYLTVATIARDRWFDLDAVRGDDLDRFEVPPDWWEIPPGGYSGSHYAVFPPELCRRPIEAMCPRRVCTTCGTPSRRVTRNDGRAAATDGDTDVIPNSTVGWTPCGCGDTSGLWDDGWLSAYAEITTAIAAARRKGTPKAERKRIRDEVLPPLYDVLAGMYRGRLDGFHTGTGWRPGHVLDPFGGSGTTAVVATGLGRTCTLIDLDERNADLARERLGMFLTDVDHATATTAEAAS